MKCFLQVLSEEIFRYSEGKIAKNVTGSQASLDNSVFIITMTQIWQIWSPAKVVYYGNYQPRPFLAFKCGGFAITEYIFLISFSRKTFK